jgi:hypothetical protein
MTYLSLKSAAVAALSLCTAFTQASPVSAVSPSEVNVEKRAAGYQNTVYFANWFVLLSLITI